MWHIITKIANFFVKTLGFIYRHAMAIVALALTYISVVIAITTHLDTTVTGHIEKIADNTQKIKEVNRDILKEVSNLSAQQDSIKKILLSQQGDIDSLKAQIDSLDTCIDNHFDGVNKTLNTRFTYIDGRLQEIK